MRTLAVMAQKGGAGKTTLALHLAVLAQELGERVLLVDTDPQRSVADWWKARAGATPELVEADASELRGVIQAARADGVQRVVIDTAPHAELAAVQAAQVADMVLIPCRPGILDLRAIGATVEIMRATKRPAAVVLNQCPPGRAGSESGITKEARAALASYGLPIFPGAIGLRASLAHALIDGRAVTEFDPACAAANELRALWRWLKEQ